MTSNTTDQFFLLVFPVLAIGMTFNIICSIEMFFVDYKNKKELNDWIILQINCATFVVLFIYYWYWVLHPNKFLFSWTNLFYMFIFLGQLIIYRLQYHNNTSQILNGTYATASGILWSLCLIDLSYSGYKIIRNIL